MKRKALFVGVDAYEDPQIRNLRCSVFDAHSMNALFEEIGYETKCLENPAQGKVLQTVGEMTSGLSAGDQFLFYFAGHGFTDSGQHLLFCSDDRYAQLRFRCAGIPFDLLEQETRAGGFDRSFLLDACRSDFLTGRRGGDGTARDLIAIGKMVPPVEVAPGSFYVLRSCSKYECAIEIESQSHGLFTLAMMDVLRRSRSSGTELLFNDILRETVKERMDSIRRDEGMTTAKQTPESDGHGVPQVLIGGTKASSAQAYRSAAPTLVTCPACFANVRIEGTHNCAKCGKKYVCETCWDREHRCCTDCAAKARQAAEAKRLWDGKTETFTLPGGVKMEMVYVAPGAFQMGSESGDDNEKPVHLVRLTKGYWIGKYPVTQRQWTALVSATGVSFTKLPVAWFSVRGGGSARVAGMDTSEFPMESVSWEDCDALAKALNRNEKDGRTWSLPTEAQWEFAAWGGNKTCGYAYSGGHDLDALGWYYENSGIRRLDDSKWDINVLLRTLASNANRTHSVREKDVGNELGIVGMSGNVWEWCADWYGAYPPGDATDPTGPASGGNRVLRGGGWSNLARRCRSAARGRYVPGYRDNDYGFRLCCSAGPRGQETE